MIELCAGSNRTPTEKRPEPKHESGKPRASGVCPVCGARVTLRANGMLHRHSNWGLRKHREESGTP